MKIAIYGAGGAIGTAIAKEALGRGHEVTAVVRDPAKVELSHDHLTVAQGDVTDSAGVTQVAKGHDAVISAVGPNWGKGDDLSVYTQGAQSLIAGVGAAGNQPRLLIVGGAGSLEVAPGLALYDTPDFPDAWRPMAKAHGDGLALYRASDIDWTFVSPAVMIQAGERTGQYRVGGDQLLTDAEGNSVISNEDYAVAMVDELENPQHIRERITVAY
jgi:putative NADH-flavin reductase